MILRKAVVDHAGRNDGIDFFIFDMFKSCL